MKSLRFTNISTKVLVFVWVVSFVFSLEVERSCFGISFSSSRVCAGNGDCVAMDACVCRYPYISLNCAVPVTVDSIISSYVSYQEGERKQLRRQSDPQPNPNEKDDTEPEGLDSLSIGLIIGVSIIGGCCFFSIFCLCVCIIFCGCLLILATMLVQGGIMFFKRRSSRIAPVSQINTSRSGVLNVNVSELDQNSRIIIRRVSQEKYSSGIDANAENSVNSIPPTNTRSSEDSYEIIMKPKESINQEGDDPRQSMELGGEVQDSVEVVTPKFQPNILSPSGMIQTSGSLLGLSYDMEKVKKHNFDELMENFETEESCSSEEIGSYHTANEESEMSEGYTYNNNEQQPQIRKPNLTINTHKKTPVNRPPPLEIRCSVEPNLKGNDFNNNRNEEDDEMNMKSPDNSSLRMFKKNVIENDTNHDGDKVNKQIQALMGIDTNPSTPQFFEKDNNKKNWKRGINDDEDVTLTGTGLLFSMNEEEDDVIIPDNKVHHGLRRKSRIDSPTCAAITTIAKRRKSVKNVDGV